jgi:hypothetical protein
MSPPPLVPKTIAGASPSSSISAAASSACAAIDYHLTGSAGFKSGNEARFLALLAAAGLREPLVNVEFDGLEIDFRWPDARLVVEVDGAGHQRPRTGREDAAVDFALRDAGCTVLRFTDAELRLRPEDVIQRVARL